VAFFFQNKTADELIKGRIGEIQFCSNCERQGNCDFQHPKVHRTAWYIYQYVMQIANGHLAYPQPGSWEYQPTWFMSLLWSGQRELDRLQREKAEGKQK
jgi:hypothetical protein